MLQNPAISSRATTSTGDSLLDVEKIRRDFPILNRRVNGKKLIYLDNAATSQKPIQVIEAMSDYYSNYNANIHRAVHQLAAESTEKYEGTRGQIKKFLNASGHEVVFAKNSTEAINIVLYSWAKRNLKAGDEVLLNVMEHHSNIVPWQSLQKDGIRLKFVDITDEGVLDNFDGMVSKNTKLISLTHVSNVIGTINPVEEICKTGRDNGAITLVDATQSVPNMPFDTKKVGCDFLVFSGHKMLGPTGVGVLLGRKEILETMPPFILGSDIIKEVKLTEATFAEPPYRFESGTPCIAEVIGLSAAIDYLEKTGMEEIRGHEIELMKFALEKMSEFEKLKIYGPLDVERRGGVISFNLGDIHSHDLASILNEDGIAIRSGHHCAQPLMRRFGVTAMARVSFYLYNTLGEIETFLESLRKAEKLFKL